MTGPAALYFYLAHWAVTLGSLGFAWWGGREPERQACIMLAIAYALSAGALRIHLDLLVAIDLALFAGLFGLALVHRRWWILVAASNALVALVAHYAVLADSSIYIRASIAYQTLPALAIAASTAFSPLERWLAGERRLPGLTDIVRGGSSRPHGPTSPALPDGSRQSTSSDARSSPGDQ